MFELICHQYTTLLIVMKRIRNSQHWLLSNSVSAFVFNPGRCSPCDGRHMVNHRTTDCWNCDKSRTLRSRCFANRGKCRCLEKDDLIEERPEIKRNRSSATNIYRPPLRRPKSLSYLELHMRQTCTFTQRHDSQRVLTRYSVCDAY
jgi:hypothetical protein